MRYKGEPVNTHDDLATAVRDYPTRNLRKAVELYDTVTIPAAKLLDPGRLKAITAERDVIQAEIDRRAGA